MYHALVKWQEKQTIELEEINILKMNTFVLMSLQWKMTILLVLVVFFFFPYWFF